jgi:hypothetical protein
MESETADVKGMLHLQHFSSGYAQLLQIFSFTQDREPDSSNPDERCHRHCSQKPAGTVKLQKVKRQL